MQEHVASQDSAAQGEAADRNCRTRQLEKFLDRGDPLADEVVRAFASMPPGRGRHCLQQALSEGIDAVEDAPGPLRALFDQLDHVPIWVDWDTLDRGGRLFRRTGALGALIMGCYALPLAYSSGAGVKPLIFSGRLVNRAPRRLSSTAQFNVAVSSPGGLRRFSAGFGTVVRVRMMHAQVRYLLRRSSRWDAEAWGTPVNQLDMAGSNLFFSVLAVDGLRKLGVRVSRRERDDVIQLWRYSGYLSGIHPDLLCATYDEGHRLADFIEAKRLVPDADSITLVKALMENALPELMAQSNTQDGTWLRQQMIGFAYGLSASLLGRKGAGRLEYPATFWRFGAPLLVRMLVAPMELFRFLVPGGTAILMDRAMRSLQRTTERGLAGRPATYAMPERLGNGREAGAVKRRDRDDQ